MRASVRAVPSAFVAPAGGANPGDGQLARPRVVTLAENAYARFTAAEVARGMRLGDIKPLALSQRTDWAEHLGSEGRHDQLARTSNRFTGARRDC